MATPSKKTEGIENLLDSTLGASRRETIISNRCVPAPIGCGGPATEFKDECSKREYTISGLCQKCQDSIFG